MKIKQVETESNLTQNEGRSVESSNEDDKDLCPVHFFIIEMHWSDREVKCGSVKRT